MRAGWGALALLIGTATIGGCWSNSSCGAILSESIGPHACWQYTDFHEGAIVGARVGACPTAGQLGSCTLPDQGASACGVIYYGDDGLSVDEARRACRMLGGSWAP